MPGALKAIDLVLLGPPGVGKTHLAITAAQLGRRVYYGALAELVTSLEDARSSGSLKHTFLCSAPPRTWRSMRSAICRSARRGAVLFYQPMSRRYEHASTVLTSSKSLGAWEEILGDRGMAGALIDRILHHCHIMNTRDSSYRVRTHTQLWQAFNQESLEGSSRS
jgi:DNA replication protein DnaC